MFRIPAKNPRVARAAAFTLMIPLLWTLELSNENPWWPGVAGEAQAIIGRPLTPFSYAGVARRTTRRFVATDAAVMAATPPPMPVAQPVVVAPETTTGTALPKGTTVSALPNGCESTQISGETLFACGSTIYKPTFKSGNLVYTVE